MTRALLIVCLAAAVAASALAQNKSDAAVQATKLADEFVAASFERSPESATFYAMPGARHDRVFDNTLEARRAWNKRVDAMQASFKAIDKRSLAGRPELLTYGFIEQALTSELERRVCRAELWSVDHLYGWQVTVPMYLSRQPVATEADRKAALARLGQYGRYIEREVEVLRSGMSSGYTAPRVNVDRVIAQIDGLLAGPPEKSPFATQVTANSNDAAFRREVAGVVGSQIAPALRRYRSFLDEYRGVARTKAGVSELPQGAACYRSLIRDNTSLDLTADEVHQLGLTQMEQIQAEMRTLGQRVFGTSDISKLVERVRTDPSLRFRNAVARWIGSSVARCSVVGAQMPGSFDPSLGGPPSDRATEPPTELIRS